MLVPAVAVSLSAPQCVKVSDRVFARIARAYECRESHAVVVVRWWRHGHERVDEPAESVGTNRTTECEIVLNTSDMQTS